MSLPLSPAGRRYGALKSDRSIHELGKPKFFGLPSVLPSSFSIEKYQPPVKDQGDEGSCTGHGWTSNAEFLFRRFKDQQVTLSPAFVYYMEREMEGTLHNGDCGAQVVSGALVMDQKGSPLISQMPYTPGDFETAPTPAQATQALAYSTGAYHRLATIIDIKECIVSGYPIVIGFTVYESFESGVGPDGLMPMPKKGEQILGGHCVWGGAKYDDNVRCPGTKHSGAFLMQNSWGTSWALGGRFWMPYEFMNNPEFVSDILVQHLGVAWK